MTIFFRSTILLLTLIIVACGSTAKLNSYGQNVKIVNIEPLECKELGRFYGRGTSLKYAMNNLLNVVGENKGTHVYVSRVEDIDGVGATFVTGNDNSAYGIAFNCNIKQ